MLRRPMTSVRCIRTRRIDRSVGEKARSAAKAGGMLAHGTSQESLGCHTGKEDRRKVKD